VSPNLNSTQATNRVTFVLEVAELRDVDGVEDDLGQLVVARFHEEVDGGRQAELEVVAPVDVVLHQVLGPVEEAGQLFPGLWDLALAAFRYWKLFYRELHESELTINLVLDLLRASDNLESVCLHHVKLRIRSTDTRILSRLVLLAATSSSTPSEASVFVGLSLAVSP
jgi:hypothetical protein